MRNVPAIPRNRFRQLTPLAIVTLLHAIPGNAIIFLLSIPFKMQKLDR
jgi:hypothetical protein